MADKDKVVAKPPSSTRHEPIENEDQQGTISSDNLADDPEYFHELKTEEDYTADSEPDATGDASEENAYSHPPTVSVEDFNEIKLSPTETPQIEPEVGGLRQRSDSQSTMATTVSSRPIPKSSLLFVVSSLESIAAS